MALTLCSLRAKPAASSEPDALATATARRLLTTFFMGSQLQFGRPYNTPIRAANKAQNSALDGLGRGMMPRMRLSNKGRKMTGWSTAGVIAMWSGGLPTCRSSVWALRFTARFAVYCVAHRAWSCGWD
ncbi:hypothetical protein GCM10007363_26360 [Pseudomonas fluvialis]|uniref:Uncharacterized protein n=1 Tax=Pseudomonas fluvialis TaxID=1793966 RepID=A0ABQ2AT62_9PSED|nr:hypothetical protein GCM10007363_26360 [Pseudomonas fluvialis]